MTIELFETPSGRFLSHRTRHRHARGSRLDRPDLRPGNTVWWQAGIFQVESVELHGERWMAALVKPGALGEEEVSCWFAPVRDLQYEPAR